MNQINCNKGKHAKKQSYIHVGFKILLSSPWHLKYWSDGWEILQIDRNYAGKDISVFLSTFMYTSLKTSQNFFVFYIHGYKKKILVKGTVIQII